MSTNGSHLNGNAAKTYRGKTLDELIPKIRAELGEDAIVLRRRDGLVGGVGGFFQRPFVEVEAQPGAPRLDVYDEEPQPGVELEALPGADFEELLGDFEIEAPPEDVFEPDIVSGFEAELAAAAEEGSDPFPAGETGEPAAAAPVARSARRPEQAERLVDELLEAGLSRELAQSIVAEAAQHRAPFAPNSTLRTLVRRSLAARIPVAAPTGPGGWAVAFAGAGGSGKSLCAQRLATAYASAGELSAVYVAYQTPATGASELLSELGVPVLAADSAIHARAAVSEHRDDALVVIDTPSAPKDPKALAGLAAQVKRIGAVEVHATVPATLSRKAASDLLARLAPFKAARMVLTHADETDHVGPAVDLAIAAALPFSFIVDGSGLVPADSAKLAQKVLP